MGLLLLLLLLLLLFSRTRLEAPLVGVSSFFVGLVNDIQLPCVLAHTHTQPLLLPFTYEI
jgi:hypothetical protein